MVEEAEEAHVWVGYRRLYDAMDCSLQDRQEWALTVQLDPSLKAELYFGPKPHYGIEIVDETSDHYIGATVSPRWTASYHADATQSGYPRTFFTEIVCLTKIAVPIKLGNAFHRSDPDACNQVLRLAEEKAQELQAILDLLAGAIGLRFHTQLVKKLINEHLVAPKEPAHAWQTHSSGYERLIDVSMPEGALQALEALIQAMSATSSDTLLSAGGVLGWLMRAWAEPQELAYKFMAFFIPLEMVLNTDSAKPSHDALRQAKAVRALIKQHAGERREDLLAFFNDLCQNLRPPLTTRFEMLARKAQIPGWEADIAAFKRFYSMRNALVHRGDPQVKLRVPSNAPSKNDVSTLEDMTERYVSYVLFGDANVYLSPWRPARRPHMDEGSTAGTV